MDKLNTIKLFVYENRKKVILISVLIVAFIISCITILKINDFKEEKQKENLVYENIIEDNIEKVKKTEEKVETIYYFVDIKGYVNNPGVYSLQKGKRVVDAINIAGGLKKDANTNLLNLSMEIFDSMVIVVYSNNEINNYQKIKEEETKTKELCKETIVNDACINTTTTTPKEENDNNSQIASEKININTATKEQLMTLSKIGESKAAAIIEYRTKNGLFKSIEELKNVSGIGETLFESIKEYITI